MLIAVFAVYGLITTFLIATLKDAILHNLSECRESNPGWVGSAKSASLLCHSPFTIME